MNKGKLDGKAITIKALYLYLKKKYPEKNFKYKGIWKAVKKLGYCRVTPGKKHYKANEKDKEKFSQYIKQVIKKKKI